MNILPGQTRALHFIGIGGIGMSGIAEVLHQSGFKVQGADIAESYNTKRLQSLGIPVFIGHDIQNLSKVQAVVISTAVRPDNIELLEARRLRIPVMHRSEMLAEIMRVRLSLAVGGTHGKTTTTSLLAWLIDAAGMDPTIVNGGIINEYNTNARLGKSNWAVVEADESDGSFTRLPATIAVVTNIDPEHMEHYGDFESLYAAFRHFVRNVPFYGLGVLCVDHPTVQKLAEEIADRRIVTYGFNENADVSAQNVKFNFDGVVFDVVIKPDYLEKQRELENYVGENVTALPAILKDIYLPMMGKHNVQNALAVVAIAQELGISDAVLRHAFKTFKGIKRRFTQVGSVHGVRIIDDYAHHPAEIRAVISSAKQAAKGKIYAVVQPHRYSRLKDLFEDFVNCFDGCEQVLVAPVYTAGETPNGVTGEDLANSIAEKGILVRYFEYPSSLAGLLTPFLEPGDMILCMGAGSITTWAVDLVHDLEQTFQLALKAVNENIL